MTGIEIMLLVLGCFFFVASFFIAEKLTPNELGKIGDLSNQEIQKVMEHELTKATASIEDKVDISVAEVIDKSMRQMEKETNDKIMAISEYSDTIIESINKTHNEIMFLYSMLNDKHDELNKIAADLQNAKKFIESNLASSRDTRMAQNRQMSDLTTQMMDQKESSNTVRPQAEPVSEPLTAIQKPAIAAMEPDITDLPNIEKQTFESDTTAKKKNDLILELHAQGDSMIDIARKLGLGLGEVQLVIGLYKGDNA